LYKIRSNYKEIKEKYTFIYVDQYGRICDQSMIINKKEKYLDFPNR